MLYLDHLSGKLLVTIRPHLASYLTVELSRRKATPELRQKLG
jgi:hypothetical protein